MGVYCVARQGFRRHRGRLVVVSLYTSRIARKFDTVTRLVHSHGSSLRHNHDVKNDAPNAAQRYIPPAFGTSRTCAYVFSAKS